jgi:hypothetical protein
MKRRISMPTFYMHARGVRYKRLSQALSILAKSIDFEANEVTLDEKYFYWVIRELGRLKEKGADFRALHNKLTDPLVPTRVKPAHKLGVFGLNMPAMEKEKANKARALVAARKLGLCCYFFNQPLPQDIPTEAQFLATSVISACDLITLKIHKKAKHYHELHGILRIMAPILYPIFIAILALSAMSIVMFAWYAIPLLTPLFMANIAAIIATATLLPVTWFMARAVRKKNAYYTVFSMQLYMVEPEASASQTLRLFVKGAYMGAEYAEGGFDEVSMSSSSGELSPSSGSSPNDSPPLSPAPSGDTFVKPPTLSGPSASF